MTSGSAAGGGDLFNAPSIRVGRLFGIPLELNASWLLIFLLVAAMLAFSYFPAVGALQGLSPVAFVLMGVVTALLFFASIVFHELSHSLVARAGGVRISKVTLFLFGGVAQMEKEPASPGHELVMAAAGPVASVLLGALFFIVYTVMRGLGASAVLWAPAEYLSLINISVAVFNMLPGFPLDGGRVLRALLWWMTGDILKATRWASRSGQVLGWGLVVLAVAGALRGSLSLLWLGLLGWFLAGLAESVYRQQVARAVLSSVPISDLMSPSPAVAPGDISLEDLAHDYFLGQRHSRYPVAVDGRIAGLVTLARVKAVPRERWPVTRVAEVMDRDLDRLLVRSDVMVDTIVDRFGPEGPGAVLVVEEGHLAGIATRADIVRELQVAGGV